MEIIKINISKENFIENLFLELKKYNIFPVITLENSSDDITLYKYKVIYTYDGSGIRPNHNLLIGDVGLVCDNNILDLDGFLEELKYEGYQIIWRKEDYKFSKNELNVKLNFKKQIKIIEETTQYFEIEILYSEIQKFCKFYPHLLIGTHDFLMHILTNNKEYQTITEEYKYHDNLKDIQYQFGEDSLHISFCIFKEIIIKE